VFITSSKTEPEELTTCASRSFSASTIAAAMLEPDDDIRAAF